MAIAPGEMQGVQPDEADLKPSPETPQHRLEELMDALETYINSVNNTDLLAGAGIPQEQVLAELSKVYARIKDIYDTSDESTQQQFGARWTALVGQVTRLKTEGVLPATEPQNGRVSEETTAVNGNGTQDIHPGRRARIDAEKRQATARRSAYVTDATREKARARAAWWRNELDAARKHGEAFLASQNNSSADELAGTEQAQEGEAQYDVQGTVAEFFTQEDAINTLTDYLGDDEGSIDAVKAKVAEKVAEFLEASPSSADTPDDEIIQAQFNAVLEEMTA